MNQDQIKKLLLAVEDAPEDFSVILSGKKSCKVNGLYHVESREIILHNKNFDDDNLLIYTALHEYAHHLHSCKTGGKLSARAHTTEFWAIFHELLEKAEKLQFYSNAYQQSDALKQLTDLIREKYIKQNGALFIELGNHLFKARDLCTAAGLRFEDYTDRILGIPRLTAKMAMKSCSYNLPAELGTDNMRLVSGIYNAASREQASSALLAGKTQDMVKMALRNAESREEPRVKLEKEKTRLVRTIDTLSGRLKEVEAAINALE